MQVRPDQRKLLSTSYRSAMSRKPELIHVTNHLRPSRLTIALPFRKRSSSPICELTEANLIDALAFPIASILLLGVPPGASLVCRGACTHLDSHSPLSPRKFTSSSSKDRVYQDNILLECNEFFEVKHIYMCM